MKRKIILPCVWAVLLAFALTLSGCGKGDGDNGVTVVNGGNGSGSGGSGSGGGTGGGSGTPTPIPTKVMGIIGAALVNLPSDNGATSRLEMDNDPAGYYYKAALTGAGAATTIRIRNANSEPRIDSASGTCYAFYPNVKHSRPDEITDADTVGNLCIIVNNGTKRWVMVMCAWPGLQGASEIFLPAVTDHFYQINNAFINDKINNSTGLKEVRNTLP